MVRIDLDIDTGKVKAAIKELKERGEGNAVYVTGTNVEYGAYLEFGTRKMPPYPWFRPAIIQFEANPEATIRANTGYNSIDEIPTTNAFVRAAAEGLANQMTKNASALSSNDRSPGVHPDHPKRVIGNLAGDISAVRVR